MIRRKKKQTVSQKIKNRARRTLKKQISTQKNKYVVDTSAIVKKFLTNLIKKGITGEIIIPNAVMAELENMANKGKEEGFIGLEEIAKLHKHKKNIQVFFEGIRPQDTHIKYAKSGEIDALIREVASKNKAILITADLVQAKSAQAYGLEVIFLKPRRIIKKQRRFLFWKS